MKKKVPTLSRGYERIIREFVGKRHFDTKKKRK